MFNLIVVTSSFKHAIYRLTVKGLQQSKSVEARLCLYSVGRNYRSHCMGWTIQSHRLYYAWLAKGCIVSQSQSRHDLACKNEGSGSRYATGLHTVLWQNLCLACEPPPKSRPSPFYDYLAAKYLNKAMSRAFAEAAKMEKGHIVFGSDF